MIKEFHFKFLKKLLKGYNLLIICLVLLFFLRPYHDSLIELEIWRMVITGSILLSLFNATKSKIARIIEVILALALILSSWEVLRTNEKWTIFAASTFSILFIFVFILTIIHDILIRKTVSFQTLKGVACAYILVAVVFAHLYWMIDFFYPGAFLISNNPVPPTSYAEYLSNMLYFSFVTLLTIGYGDIVPTLKISQTAVIIEGVVGQFYVILFIARLVSLYSSRKK